MIEDINRHLKTHNDTIKNVAETLVEPVLECVGLVVSALKSGNKILTMGNGGSAADAQHLAAELVGRFLMKRKALPAIALTTDTSVLTAVGNDFGFDEVFKRQVEALASPGDILVGISTSGNSANVVRALEAGREAGVISIGLLGHDGGEIGKLVDLALIVPTSDTPRIQEAHQFIIHVLCDLVEKSLFPS